jgi:ElaB/YqjD/DUF883 family membrane-anchored ribosome-binding protein
MEPATDELFIDEEHELGDLPRDFESQARRVSEWTREQVFAHPFAALGIAVAAGFVVGRLVSR